MAITHLKNIPTKRKRILTRFTYVYVRKNILLYKSIITDNIDNITAKKTTEIHIETIKTDRIYEEGFKYDIDRHMSCFRPFFKEGVNEMNGKWLVLNGAVVR